MAQAFGRKRGIGDWVPITWGGLHYYATRDFLVTMIGRMRHFFPDNEYKIEDE